MTKKRDERLEKVKEIVLAKGAITAQELASELGTSRRTIYRYIDSLRKEGIAIDACPGSTGGFRLSTGADSRNMVFTEDEALAVLLLGSAVCEAGVLPYNDHLESAIEKVRRSLSEKAWADIREAMPNVSLMVEPLFNQTVSDHVLDDITEAIAHKRGLGISYYTLHRDDQVEREIDPFHLFYQGGAWYVVAYCHVRKDVRTFRVDRIRELSIQDRNFERPPKFSFNSYIGSAWGIMRGQRHSVKVKFLPPISRLIAESQWHPTQETEFTAEGHLIFCAEVDGLEEIKRWVISFAEYAEVLEPQELKESILTSIRGMASNYCLYESPDKA